MGEGGVLKVGDDREEETLFGGRGGGGDISSPLSQAQTTVVRQNHWYLSLL